MPTIGTVSRPAYVYDQETDTWVPVGVGPHTHENFIQATLIDAKGDLIVGLSPDTPTRLAAGANGTFLRANSAAPGGLEWSIIDALPSQSGNSGKYLTTNGTTASWAEVITDPMPQIMLLMGS